MATKKKSAAKKPAVKKSAAGLSEAEHGQGWQRNEACAVELDESETNGGPGDEDDDDNNDDEDD